MNFKELSAKRRSIRSFKDQAVKDDDLRDIVATAQQAASWVDEQPATAYIVKDDKLNEVRDMHSKFVDANSDYDSDIPYSTFNNFADNEQDNMKGWLSDRDNFFEQNDVHNWDELQQNLFHAPAAVYLTIDKPKNDWVMYDLGAFANDIMLAAADKGIDSVPAYEFVKFSTELHKILGIPDDKLIAMGLGLGYKDDDKINNFLSSRVAIDDAIKIIK